MVMLAVYPIPVLSLVASVVLTAAIVGWRYAFLVFLAGMASTFFQLAAFSWVLYDSLTATVNQMIVQVKACPTQACVNQAVANATARLEPAGASFWNAEPIIMIVEAAAIGFLLLRAKRLAKTIRNRTLMIRKYKWTR